MGFFLWLLCLGFTKFLELMKSMCEGHLYLSIISALMLSSWGSEDMDWGWSSLYLMEFFEALAIYKTAPSLWEK